MSQSSSSTSDQGPGPDLEQSRSRSRSRSPLLRSRSPSSEPEPEPESDPVSTEAIPPRNWQNSTDRTLAERMSLMFENPENTNTDALIIYTNADGVITQIPIHQFVLTMNSTKFANKIQRFCERNIQMATASEEEDWDMDGDSTANRKYKLNLTRYVGNSVIQSESIKFFAKLLYTRSLDNQEPTSQFIGSLGPTRGVREYLDVYYICTKLDISFGVVEAERKILSVLNEDKSHWQLYEKYKQEPEWKWNEDMTSFIAKILNLTVNEWTKSAEFLDMSQLLFQEFLYSGINRRIPNSRFSPITKFKALAAWSKRNKVKVTDVSTYLSQVNFSAMSVPDVWEAISLGLLSAQQAISVLTLHPDIAQPNGANFIPKQFWNSEAV